MSHIHHDGQKWYSEEFVEELEAEVERLKAANAMVNHNNDNYTLMRARIEAALAMIDKRLERTREWTQHERNALRSIREALTGGRE